MPKEVPIMGAPFLHKIASALFLSQTKKLVQQSNIISALCNSMLLQDKICQGGSLQKLQYVQQFHPQTYYRSSQDEKCDNFCRDYCPKRAQCCRAKDDNQAKELHIKRAFWELRK